MNEIEVAVLCNRSDGAKALYRCKVEATPEQIQARYHYSCAEQVASANGYMYPMFAFSSDDAAWHQLEMKSTPKPIAPKPKEPNGPWWVNLLFVLACLALVHPAWQSGKWLAESLSRGVISSE